MEALKQNQLGGTVGDPLVHDRVYIFSYCEGLRNVQDITPGMVAPTMAERYG